LSVLGFPVFSTYHQRGRDPIGWRSHVWFVQASAFQCIDGSSQYKQ